MAGHLMARPNLYQFGFFLHAAFRAVRTAVAEGASRRQVQRAGRLALNILNFLCKVHLHVKDRF